MEQTVAGKVDAPKKLAARTSHGGVTVASGLQNSCKRWRGGYHGG